MITRIYQINSDRDTLNRSFISFRGLKQLQQSDDVDASVYDLKFSAELGTNDLDETYRILNDENSHPLLWGHSLSVSDVIVNENGAFYCDSFGFQPIEFDETKAQQPEYLMRVLYVEPHRSPYIAEIPRTLEAEQKAVHGFIEPVYLGNDVILVGNEESKLIGMEGNRRLDGGTIIAGPFFLCGDAGEEFRSLTDEEVVTYMDRFKEPEDISPEEVEADTGFAVYGFFI